MESHEEDIQRIRTRRVKIQQMMKQADAEHRAKMDSWAQRLDQLAIEETKLIQRKSMRGYGQRSQDTSSTDSDSVKDMRRTRRSAKMANGHDGPPGFSSGASGRTQHAPPGFDSAPRGFDSAPPGFDSAPPGFDSVPPGFDTDMAPRSSDVAPRRAGAPPGFEGAARGGSGRDDPANMKFGELQRLLATRGARTSTLRPTSAANGHAGSHVSQEESKPMDARDIINKRRLSANDTPPAAHPSTPDGGRRAEPPQRSGIHARLGAPVHEPVAQAMEEDDGWVAEEEGSRWEDSKQEGAGWEDHKEEGAGWEDRKEEGSRWGENDNGTAPVEEDSDASAETFGESGAEDPNSGWGEDTAPEWRRPQREAVPVAPPNLTATKVRVIETEAPLEAPVDDFPSLAMEASSAAPRPAGAWGGARPAAEVLAAAAKDREAAVAQAIAQEYEGKSIEVFETNAGLRSPGDPSTDQERRRQARKREFDYTERVRGQDTNVVEGLELHTQVLNTTEQALLVETIKKWEMMGREGILRGRTFSNPRKSMRGKGRVTIQFGTCYNYAVDKQGRKPGIIPEEVVEPLPPVLVALTKRLVRWGILPKKKEPDTAIVNIYDVDDCIPPHIDHHDFDRPFVTVSLLSEQSIMFGSRLIPLAPGEFAGSNCFIALPVGSCLVLKGKGADVAMHCVPPVTAKRISITLRCMGDAHARRVREHAARALLLQPSPFLKESLPQISAQTGTKSSTRWSDAVDDDELEVERRRARPRSFKLGDMWPALKV